MKSFFGTVCGPNCTTHSPTTVEWYLIFTCAAVVLSQLPNLNSIAGVSLIGAITALGYCTMIWVISVDEGRIPNVSYNPVRAESQIARTFDLLNALGIIAFAFRGHNLILEIQVHSILQHNHCRINLTGQNRSFGCANRISNPPLERQICSLPN